MSRFWPFRSVGNFTLSLLGVCGVSFYGYGMYRQTYFSNPVVSQTVKILGKNQKIKQMIGYPLSYQSSNNNKFNQTGNQVYFSFKVIGPRGSTQVQVTASQLKAKDIYQYDQQNQALKNTKNNLTQLQKEQSDLQSNLNQLKKSSSGSSWLGGNKNQDKIKKLEEQIIQKSKQVNQIQKFISDMNAQRNNRKNLYYIPQKQYYTQIVSQNGKNNQASLPQNAVLYKIQNVACQLPNKSRINVLNSGKAVRNQDDQTNIQMNAHLQEFKKPIYAKLHQKLAVNVSQLSDQQMQQYSKHKTNFMYQKYNMYRVLLFFVFMIGSASAFIYFAKNKTKNMSNSVLFYLTQNRLNKSAKIRQLLRKRNINSLQLDKNVGGGMKNNQFKCQVGIKNITMGKIQFEGKKTKSGDYEYSRLCLKYLQDNKHHEIDLLK